MFLGNTSFHGDHCFGNFAFPAQTVIIHHEATKRVIDERFEQGRAFMIDLLGANAGIEEAVARSADVTVTGSCSLDWEASMWTSSTSATSDLARVPRPSVIHRA